MQKLMGKVMGGGMSGGMPGGFGGGGAFGGGGDEMPDLGEWFSSLFFFGNWYCSSHVHVLGLLSFVLPIIVGGDDDDDDDDEMPDLVD